MPNMSYCRFQNTADDLQDCWDSLATKEPAELSPEERRAFKRLVRLCELFFDDYEDYAKEE